MKQDQHVPSQLTVVGIRLRYTLFKLVNSMQSIYSTTETVSQLQTRMWSLSTEKCFNPPAVFSLEKM